jgi:2'-5' RNA ligase
MSSIRSFIAIPLSQISRDRLVVERDDLSQIRTDIKPIYKANMHITMKFLGNITEELIRNILVILNNISINQPPFEFSIEKIGAFPSIKQARVVWAGINKGEKNFIELEEKISDKLTELDFTKDRRPFKPHITIARLKNHKIDYNLEEYLKNKRDIVIGKDICKGIQFMKSTLTPQGAVYEELDFVEFKDK